MTEITDEEKLRAANYCLSRALAAEAQVEVLKAEIAEARKEAATVRRAYLHERGRANLAIHVLRAIGAFEQAEELAEQAYAGSAEKESGNGT